MAAFKLDPENKPVKTELAKLKKAIKDAKAKEKATFGGLFDKVSMYDEKPDNIIVHSGDNPKVRTPGLLTPQSRKPEGED